MCAFVHQVVVASLGFAALARQGEPAEVERWLVQGWPVGSRADSAEMVIMLANLSEMMTDWLLYARYRGFQTGYHMHHLLTAVATCAFIWCDSAPVGFAVAYSSVMEAGGACLNLSGLFPCRFTYTLRLWGYVLSRVAATALLVACTAYAARGRVGVPLAALAPVWALALLNLRWAADLLFAALRRGQRDPWAAAAVPAVKRADG